MWFGATRQQLSALVDADGHAAARLSSRCGCRHHATRQPPPVDPLEQFTADLATVREANDGKSAGSALSWLFVAIAVRFMHLMARARPGAKRSIAHWSVRRTAAIATAQHL